MNNILKHIILIILRSIVLKLMFYDHITFVLIIGFKIINKSHIFTICNSKNKKMIFDVI